MPEIMMVRNSWLKWRLYLFTPKLLPINSIKERMSCYVGVITKPLTWLIYLTYV